MDQTPLEGTHVAIIGSVVLGAVVFLLMSVVIADIPALSRAVVMLKYNLFG